MLANMLGMVGPDVVVLSVLGACKQLGLPRAEGERFIKSMEAFRQKTSIFPPGFM